MVKVLEEVKVKLVESDGKMDELRYKIVFLEAQKFAFKTVIRVCDASFKLAARPSKVRCTSSRETTSGRVSKLLKGKNNRHIVLDSLWRSGKPASTAEVAERFTGETDLGSEAARLESTLASRFSATLNDLAKQGVARQAGSAEDGHRHLWEFGR